VKKAVTACGFLANAASNVWVLKVAVAPLPRVIPRSARVLSVPAPATRTDDAPAPNSLYDAPNFLLQKFPAPEFTVTTSLDFSPAAEGETAGLVVYGYDYAVLGLRRTATGIRLVLRINKKADQPGPKVGG